MWEMTNTHLNFYSYLFIEIHEFDIKGLLNRILLVYLCVLYINGCANYGACK